MAVTRTLPVYEYTSTTPTNMTAAGSVIDDWQRARVFMIATCDCFRELSRPETKELVGGFWIWQVKSKDEAIEWLKRAPFRS